MSEHLSNEIVDSYLLRRLMPAELLAADDHLTNCEHCRERLYLAEGLSKVSLLQFELNSPPETIPRHADYQQLARYIDKTLAKPDLEILRTHLDSCLDCVADILDLLAFKQEIESGNASRS